MNIETLGKESICLLNIHLLSQGNETVAKPKNINSRIN